MEVHWVAEGDVVVHDDADAFVLGKVVDIAFGIEGGGGVVGGEMG